VTARRGWDREGSKLMKRLSVLEGSLEVLVYTEDESLLE
jgi:hypothetical protein